MSTSANILKYKFLAFRNVCSVCFDLEKAFKCTDRTIVLMLDVINTNE